jgi:membrane protease YdiL (CAAX protease family)
MTGPDRGESTPEPAPSAPDAIVPPTPESIESPDGAREPPTNASVSPDDGSAPPPAPPDATRPGLGTFTIEGRAAPGLFVVGWLATLLGLGIVFVGFLAPSGLLVYFLGPVVLATGLIAGAGNQAIERRAHGEAYAGPSPYLVFAAMIAATYAIGFPVGLVLRALLGTNTPEYVVRLLGVTLQALVFVGVVRLTVVGTNALSWREMGWRRPDGSTLPDLSTGALFAVPVIFITSILAVALVNLFRVEPEAPLPATGTTVGLIVQLIAGAVIAPIAEETVFRGFAITAWRRTVGDNGALIRASLLFALAHVLTVSGDSLGQVGGLIVVGFVTRLPVALALGWLFLRRGSIWAPLGLHMAFNGVLLVLGELAVNAATGSG